MSTKKWKMEISWMNETVSLLQAFCHGGRAQRNRQLKQHSGLLLAWQARFPSTFTSSFMLVSLSIRYCIAVEGEDVRLCIRFLPCTASSAMFYLNKEIELIDAFGEFLGS